MMEFRGISSESASRHQAEAYPGGAKSVGLLDSIERNP